MGKLEKEKAARQVTKKGKDDDNVDSDAEDGGSKKKRRVSDDGGDKDFVYGERPEKEKKEKKRFHPFGWGAKKTRQATAGGQKTVEINSGSSKQRGGKKGKDRG